MTHRAYALLDIKAVKDDEWVIEGIASTPTPDRVGDIVEPMGAQFKLPLPLLWQHNSYEPIGHVEFAKPTKAGIPFRARIIRPETVDSKELKERLQLAWDSMKSKLVRFVSIGFRVLEYSILEDGGWRISKWEWLELSPVTIPAQSEAIITGLKKLDAAAISQLRKFDTGTHAPSGIPVRLSNTRPPVSGKSISIKTNRPKEGLNTMKKNVGAQIAALKEQRKEKADALEAIQTKASDEGRTKTPDERKEFDDLHEELKTLDAELADLEAIENLYKPSSKAVGQNTDTAEKPRVYAEAKKKEAPGVLLARRAKVKAVSRMDIVPELVVAEKMYGRDSQIYAIIKANEVAPGTTLSGNWAADLIGAETSAYADFAEYLRPSTILGKFGQNGIPNLRSVPFREPLITQTGAGAGHWVGEGKPKPVTSFDFDRTTLTPLKVANICVLSEENIRSSSPSSELIIRDALRDALAATQDVAFIDPANNGIANSKPPAVTYQAATVAAESTGDADDVRTDVRSLMQKFINANNPPSQGVWIMQSSTALSLSLMVNALGQPEFSGIGMAGGVFMGLPVITSDYVPDGVVVLVNASDIFLGDEGDVTVDMSREASLEMKSVPVANPVAPGTGAELVSLWQNNLVALRAEKTINWKLRRASAVAYLTGVAWGGAVNAS